MDFVKRHMDMAASSSMDMSHMASSTMDMAMETGMNMASSNSSSSSLSSMSMDSHKMGMHMWFTTEFKDYPVLFKTLTASTKGEAFGIFVLLFFAAFFSRLLEFVRNYLEEVVWNNDTYTEYEAGIANHAARVSMEPTRSCADDSIDKDSGIQENIAHPQNVSGDNGNGNGNGNGAVHNNNSNNGISMASKLVRDAIRLALCIVPDLFGYTLMLAAMTYTLTYFFAVVIGSGVGRFVSERLSENFRIKRKIPARGCVC